MAQKQGATHARASQFVRDLASVMSAAVSTRNPAPCDLGMAVMKVKANGDMCTRDDDEAMVFERLMQIVYAWGVFLM